MKRKNGQYPVSFSKSTGLFKAGHGLQASGTNFPETQGGTILLGPMKGRLLCSILCVQQVTSTWRGTSNFYILRRELRIFTRSTMIFKRGMDWHSSRVSIDIDGKCSHKARRVRPWARSPQLFFKDIVKSSQSP